MTTDFPTIIIAGHNRPEDLKILLRSVMIAKATAGIEAHVVVSIDGNNSDVIAVARHFASDGVEVRVNSAELGLRRHILQCGDLCSEFGSVLMLEDDLILTPAALSFVADALPKVRDQDDVASLSLFNFQFSDFSDSKTHRTECLGDIFYARTGSSWGQVWWHDRWFEFRKWLENDYDPAKTYRVPKRVFKWPAQSWKKLFNFWLSEHGYYSAAPYHSVALCTGGVTGTNVAGSIGVWFSQVRTIPGQVEVRPLPDAMKLDEFLELEMHGETLKIGTTGISLSDVEFDLAGSKRQKDIKKSLVFTRREHSAEAIVMRLDASLGNPLLALAIGKQGDGLYLVKAEHFSHAGDFVFDDRELRLHIPWVSSKRLAASGLRSAIRGLVKSVT